jgi:uncharacterized membrane protein YiaA
MTLDLFRQCGIICFFMGLWNCSDHVVLFVFLLDFGTVPRVWHYLLLYWILELFRQCGMICFSMGLWNCSDSVALFVFHFSIGLWNCCDSVALVVFLCDLGTVPTMWHY